MPKRLKYKRGFTLRHYWDEWWDRRPVGWKIGTSLILGVFGMALVLILVIWGLERLERSEIRSVAHDHHQKRIEAVDRQIITKTEPDQKPAMGSAPAVEIRSAE